MRPARPRPPRRRGGRAFYPAPWLVAAPLVAVAAVLGSWQLAVAAAVAAVLVMRSLLRRGRW